MEMKYLLGYKNLSLFDHLRENFQKIPLSSATVQMLVILSKLQYNWTFLHPGKPVKRKIIINIFE